MPTSQHRQISTILDAIIALDPNSVLDVGVGFGKYGVLCREYLELWDGREAYGSWKRRIDGIEAFEAYLTPLHAYIYDHLFVGDACSVVPRLEEKYDVVLLIDMLEHLPRRQGEALVKLLLKRKASVLISVPKDLGEQKGAFQNPYETHRAAWRPRDFRRLGPCRFLLDATSCIVVLGSRLSLAKLDRGLSKQKIETFIYAHPWIAKMYRRMLKKKK